MKRSAAHPKSVSPEPRPKSWTSDLAVPEPDMDASSVAPSETGTEVERRHHIKYGRPLQAIWGLFSDYANNSSIHGVRYMGERRRPLVERVWWVIAFLLSIYGCSRLIYNVWNKWDQSPVIVSFAEKSTPVWQIPFPAGKWREERKGKKMKVERMIIETPMIFLSYDVPWDESTIRSIQLHGDVPHHQPDNKRKLELQPQHGWVRRIFKRSQVGVTGFYKSQSKQIIFKCCNWNWKLIKWE